jgi:hypothetical protein
MLIDLYAHLCMFVCLNSYISMIWMTSFRDLEIHYMIRILYDPDGRLL